MGGDKTKRDLRVVICRLAGTRESSYHTPISKTSANSVLAYLTGELPEKPKFLYADRAPSRREMLLEIAQECDLTDWLYRYKSYKWGVRSFPEFAVSDLKSILVEMRARGDQRDWV